MLRVMEIGSLVYISLHLMGQKLETTIYTKLNPLEVAQILRDRSAASIQSPEWRDGRYFIGKISESDLTFQFEIPGLSPATITGKIEVHSDFTQVLLNMKSDTGALKGIIWGLGYPLAIGLAAWAIWLGPHTFWHITKYVLIGLFAPWGLYKLMAQPGGGQSSPPNLKSLIRDLRKDLQHEEMASV